MPGFRTDISDCLGEFEVFCMPSQAEGLGSAALEAMAARLPVVTTNAGGLAEVFKDGQNGLVVPPRNPERMAEAICQMLRDPTAAKRMAEAGRRTVEGEYATDRMVERTLALYEELLAAK